MTNKEICELLNKRGLRITEKNFNYVLSNPFYCGYVTGGLVQGELIKGHHPGLIDMEMFIKANDLIQSSLNVGIPKKQKHEDLPLKIFAREGESGAQLTGFRQKGIWYYKAKGARFCMNASHLNQQFAHLLSEFEFKKKYRQQLKKSIEKKLKEKLSKVLEESIQIKKRITELKNHIELWQEKYVLNRISEEMYQKLNRKYNEELVELETEFASSLFDSSNLEKAVEKGLQIAESLSQQWLSKDYNGKQKLQYLVFPEGIRCIKENPIVQTLRINSLFAQIEPRNDF
jgi:site-specific DNA recombinase